MARVRTWFVPPSIGLLGLGLRLYHIDSQSLWRDELFSMSVAHSSWAAMHASLVKDVVLPPLHYYALHAWFELFGFGSVQARLVSVALGTLSILVLYALTNYLFDVRTAAGSSLLLAASQTGVQFSQAAPAYAQFLRLALGST